ncbi:endonuclease/exonuclease/phosphatase family protein [Oscillatoria salina]|uniref:endonuclease/exonuclease/phosphatase family protein n=1 Tax=Oscillatoria salina TaxID=331517 RepID=UPI0013BC05F5|nr:endonuclease/exonuclease/phosphatase family protein [Oscillatoria salina]MBZ8178662.1 endonuclease/exonuclease/phosphatase family protein [Oscillatoria salina IIICB1]NET87292.1 endonuclease/exonuclease/phosphatase family protein [Kamptonema sp. SIO1D9]
MQLKVITFNIRYDKPDPGENNWQVRKKAIASLIDRYSPDLIGTQEGKAHQLLDLHRMLPAYQSVGSSRTPDGAGEYCAILYRRDRCQCLQTNEFWLSDTPEIPGSVGANWGNHLPRIVTSSVFALTNQDKKVTLSNTHFDYDSTKARDLGAKLIHSRLSKFNWQDSYLFLTGDFNSPPDSFPRQTLANIPLHDALAGRELNQQMTYHEFTGKAFAAIDTIYYDKRVKLNQVKIDTSRWEKVFPSDHFPVIAEFEQNE